MGVLFIATLFVPLLNREWRPEQLHARAPTPAARVLAGLGVRHRLAALHRPHAGRDPHRRRHQDTVGEGGVLLAFYSLGLAVPFMLSALAFTRFSGSSASSATTTRRSPWSSGVILIVMGVLLYTNELTRLNAEALSLMDDLGINFSAILGRSAVAGLATGHEPSRAASRADCAHPAAPAVQLDLHTGKRK